MNTVWPPTLPDEAALEEVLSRPNPLLVEDLAVAPGDLLDKSLRRGLVISDGNLSPFLTRPVRAVLAAVVLLTLMMNIPAGNLAIKRALGVFRRPGAA